MVELDINEVAQRSGLPASALRFYEEKGLIRSHGRRGHMQCPTFRRFLRDAASGALAARRRRGAVRRDQACGPRRRLQAPAPS